VFVEAFVTQSSVEGFHVRILIGLSRLDESKRDAIAMRPGQHRLARELWSVIGTDDCRFASLRADAIEDPREVIAADGVLGCDRHCFVCTVVHDRQTL
jgi:hypothetical protein